MRKTWVNFWGPSAWRFLHSVSFTLEDRKNSKDFDESKKEFINFLRSIHLLLPCPGCRTEIKKFIEKNPLDEKLTATEISEWLFKAQTSVTDRKRKIEREMFGVDGDDDFRPKSVEEVREFYNSQEEVVPDVADVKARMRLSAIPYFDPIAICTMRDEFKVPEINKQLFVSSANENSTALSYINTSSNLTDYLRIFIIVSVFLGLFFIFFLMKRMQK